MTWIITLVNLLGTFLNCKKKVSGFIIWLICNVAWMLYDIISGNYARAVLDVVQGGFCIYGIVEWRKNR